MGTSVTVRCRRPYDLDAELFTDTADQFRNALFLPPPAFDELDLSNYEYVRLRDPERTARGIRVVAVRVESCPALIEPDHYVGALRTNLYNKVSSIARTEDGGLVVDVCVDETVTQFSGTAGRTYDDEIDYRVCHLSECRMEQLGIATGSTVELFNPATGGRIDVVVGAPHDDPALVRVDVRSRQAIDIEPGDGVGVRNTGITADANQSLSRWIQKFFIDSREMPFNVRLGPDQDEYRNVVRMTEDMMAFLGIDPGDNVVLKWRGKRTKAQCLTTELDDDSPPNTIKMPATERDRIDISVHDAVSVERDMVYVFQEQIARSVFGIIGVVVGALQVIVVTDVSGIVEQHGLAFTAAGFVLAVAGVSVLVTYLLLTPERQKCVSHE
ncbi:hypothetical protein [Halobellus captivus]|uniref:hypothetical protein n=1 Tax=Halobellus captivus TaxID=2592614 RepID=UPI001396A72F|nr:hypothetical protein [Halobellus captivus]